MFIKYNGLHRHIGRGEKVFIIAEIGQNHQGDLKIAKELIELAKNAGADCVKFQKTNLKEKFTNAALHKPYLSPNAFGETYGKHKEYLEFSDGAFIELQQFADDVGIFFTASPMDTRSLDFLVDLNVPFIKIGSGDANNFPLIEKAAKTNIPLIISTGMQNFTTVRKIYDLISCSHKNFALLHCVSSYPTPEEDINLKVLELYQKEFPEIVIGYSGHEIGSSIAIAAVAMGCKVIEKHITIEKSWKGSDHKCSLEPHEFKKMVQDIRSVEKAMGKPVKEMQPSERACYDKLGKTLVYAKSLKKHHVITEGDLTVKVADPKGIDGCKIFDVYNKTLKIDVEEDQSVLEEHWE